MDSKSIMQPATSSRAKLRRSSSSLSVQIPKNPSHLHWNSPLTNVSKGDPSVVSFSSRNPTLVHPLKLKNANSLNLITKEERLTRIQSLIGEVKKEKPLGKCPLFKMTLTFRSFVWTPFLDSIYTTSCSDILKKNEIVIPKTLPVNRKPLLRSNSITSLKSTNEILDIPQNTPGNTAQDSEYGSQGTERKDMAKLNMLSTIAQPVIKFKIQKAKNNNLQQTDLASHRSLKLGAVPKYLTSRKAEWAKKEEEKLKNLPDPDCPPGHILMPECERLETLSQLHTSHKEMVEEFNCLPVSKDTLRIRQKREDIEKQLVKVEEGIRVLSKPKVFVRIDS